MRGFFGIGAEGMSKPMNMGNLVRSAHAFGASFAFLINAHYRLREQKSDTAASHEHMPLYLWDSVADMVLPRKCQLVGIELTDAAIDLPSFQHPLQAAYILGPERGALSAEVMERCDHIVRIPTKFCVNVQIAGAIVMYDRVRTLGAFPPRAVRAGGPVERRTEHKFGAPIKRT